MGGWLLKFGAVPGVALFVSLSVAGPALHAQTTAAQKPLTKAQIEDLVASGLDSQRIVNAVQRRGIDFTPSDQYLETLGKKGANQALLDALRAAKPTPLSKSELVHLLAVDKTSQSVQAMVERRGIDFKPTDEDLDTLRIAGATEGLVKAVREAKLSNPQPQLPMQPTMVGPPDSKSPPFGDPKGVAVTPKPALHERMTYIHCPAEKYQIEVYAEPNPAAVITTRLACGEDVTVLAKNQGPMGIDRIRNTQGVEGYVFDTYVATTEDGGDGLGVGGGFSGGLFSVGGGVSAPIPIYSPDPPYSEEARKARFAGTVVVQIIVDIAGNVRDAKVVKPLGLGLDEKAIETLRTWVFKPALRNGTPVNVRMLVEVSFWIPVYAQCSSGTTSIGVYAAPVPAQTVATLQCGEEVRLLGKDEGKGFDRIRTREGREGYVFDSYIGTTKGAGQEASTAARSDRDESCRLRFAVMMYDSAHAEDRSRYRVGLMTDRQWKWWEGNGQKKYRDLCLTDDSSHADYVIAWASQAYEYVGTRLAAGLTQIRVAGTAGSIANYYLVPSVEQRTAFAVFVLNQRTGQAIWQSQSTSVRPDKAVFERAMEFLESRR